MPRGWAHKNYGDIYCSEIKHIPRNGISSCQKLYPNIYILCKDYMTHGVGGGWEFGISTQGEELLPPRSLTFDKAMFIGTMSKQSVSLS